MKLGDAPLLAAVDPGEVHRYEIIDHLAPRNVVTIEVRAPSNRPAVEVEFDGERPQVALEIEEPA